MMEQLQSDFLFWIFIYFLIVGLLIRNINLTRKIKSIEKTKYSQQRSMLFLALNSICPINILGS